LTPVGNHVGVNAAIVETAGIVIVPETVTVPVESI
jgi:hypothetical protein